MKRILFVDDEVLILEGLMNRLRRRRDQWQMTFVSSGREALEVLAHEPFDVVVTDMRMPEMDGATLLKRVRIEHPSVIRIVLSGYAELESALRSVPLAHQFLNKPCDAQSLQNVIERACSLHALLTDEAIRAAVGSVARLPPVPRIYFALTEALQDPNVAVKDLARLVEQDMAICSKVLQLVNSAFFGLPKRMSNIHNALTYLGVNIFKRVILSVEAYGAFDSQPRLLPLEPLQQHSVLTGRIASLLLDDKVKTEEAFIAGMLHDIGKLVLASYVPDKLSAAMKCARRNGEPLYAAETRLNGVCHGHVGAYLLGIWGLPYPVVEAIAFHHEPNRIPHTTFDVPDAVYVADVLAQEILKYDGDCPVDELDTAYLDSLGVGDRLDTWRGWVRDIAREVMNE